MNLDNGNRTFVAHGPIHYNKDINKLLEFYLKHRQERENKILEAIKNRSNSMEKIFQSAYTDVNPSMFIYASSNILLHLKKLAQEKKIDQHSFDTIVKSFKH